MMSCLLLLEFQDVLKFLTSLRQVFRVLVVLVLPVASVVHLDTDVSQKTCLNTVYDVPHL